MIRRYISDVRDTYRREISVIREGDIDSFHIYMGCYEGNS
jgi:hypothetical protein